MDTASVAAKNTENTRRMGDVDGRCAAAFAPEGADEPA